MANGNMETELIAVLHDEHHNQIAEHNIWGNHPAIQGDDGYLYMPMVFAYPRIFYYRVPNLSEITRFVALEPDGE